MGPLRSWLALAAKHQVSNCRRLVRAITRSILWKWPANMPRPSNLLALASLALSARLQKAQRIFNPAWYQLAVTHDKKSPRNVVG